MTESLLKPAPQVGHDPEAVYRAARDGIKKQDDLALLKPMAYQNTYAVAVPKKIAQEYGLQDHFRFEKVEGQLRQALPWSLMTERTGTRACRRFTDSIYKSPPWSQPFATRRSSPVTSRSQMLTQRMPSWLAMTLVVLKMISNSSHLIKGRPS